MTVVDSSISLHIGHRFGSIPCKIFANVYKFRHVVLTTLHNRGHKAEIRFEYDRFLGVGVGKMLLPRIPIVGCVGMVSFLCRLKLVINICFLDM